MNPYLVTCFKLEMNEFGYVESGGQVNIVFHMISFLNHHCNPNCIMIMNGMIGVLISIRPIETDEELTICYIVENDRRKREKTMLKYRFTCQCGSCDVRSADIVLNAQKDLDQYCMECGKKGKTYKCSIKNCLIRYCGEKCHKAGWKFHKAFCVQGQEKFMIQIQHDVERIALEEEKEQQQQQQQLQNKPSSSSSSCSTSNSECYCCCCCCTPK